MILQLDLNSTESYRQFLAVKRLPHYRFVGRTAIFPDEYGARLGLEAPAVASGDYRPIPGLFDYQEYASRLSIHKRKFAVFMDCGLGKTNVLTEYAKHVSKILPPGRCVLIVSPLMVVEQTLAEVQKFYGDSLPIERIKSSDLPRWLESGTARIGITNYEAMTDDLRAGRLGALILDESAMLASMYGKWGATCIRIGKGLDWKLALTGTPAPNDRIEYANHSVFLDAFPTTNSFLARFFVNRGQTGERWELKPHALRPFYRALSHWCLFLTDPATYGFKDNSQNIPPIHVHIHDVDLTPDQVAAVGTETGRLFVGDLGGIVSRSKLGRLAKGSHNGHAVATNKPAYIRALVDSWSDRESTIVWCIYNDEQEAMERVFPEAASIKGDTPYEERKRLIDDFKAGRRKVLISKAKILGLGLNLQVATRQVFSGLQDSYLNFYQCVKRSNRVGSTWPLNVHLPVTDLERPMIDTVLRKAHRVEQDTREQEALFKETGAFTEDFR